LNEGFAVDCSTLKKSRIRYIWHENREYLFYLQLSKVENVQRHTITKRKGGLSARSSRLDSGRETCSAYRRWVTYTCSSILICYGQKAMNYPGLYGCIVGPPWPSPSLVVIPSSGYCLICNRDSFLPILQPLLF
jgi:hypothetical protein